jgi:hypothetical protein
MQLIVNSGIVVLNPDGDHIPIKEDVIELDTPYIVRVAMPKTEYESALASDEPVNMQKAKTPMDIGVLSHIFTSEDAV